MIKKKIFLVSKKHCIRHKVKHKDLYLTPKSFLLSIVWLLFITSKDMKNELIIPIR